MSLEAESAVELAFAGHPSGGGGISFSIVCSASGRPATYDKSRLAVLIRLAVDTESVARASNEITPHQITGRKWKQGYTVERNDRRKREKDCDQVPEGATRLSRKHGGAGRIERGLLEIAYRIQTQYTAQSI
jgi:hypothetical protein